MDGMEKYNKESVLNKNNVLVEKGKTYFYYNIGLREIKPHFVKYIYSIWAVDVDGRVEIDSLFYNKQDVK